MTEKSGGFTTAARAILDINEIEELRELSSLLRNRFSLLEARTARKFHIDQKVKFRKRDGSYAHGVVTAVNKKTIRILEPGRGGWRVSPYLVEEDDTLA